MKLLKNRFFLVLITAIICITGTAYASNIFRASEITYTNTKGEETTVGETLNWFYSLLSNKKFSDLTIINEGRNTFDIPTGVNKAYVVYSNGTNNAELQLSITGDTVVSTNIIGYSSDVDRYSNNLRSSVQIHEVTLTGEGGTINTSTYGGSGSYRAWTVLVLY